MDPLVKDYLRTHSFKQLEEEHGVFARFNAAGDKCSLNYDSICAKSGDPVAGQCRGLVVRPIQFDPKYFGDGWKDAIVGKVEVLTRPMDRFYNHGDPSAADIDWADPGLRVYEKLDGTCIMMYWDPLHGKWYAATRSVPEADLPINAGSLVIGDTTFSGLFWSTLETMYDAGIGQDSAYEFEDWFDRSFDPHLTYVFELVSPHNQIVVSYARPQVYLLAARNVVTGAEVHIENLAVDHVLRPKSWPIRSVEELAAFVDAADPSQLEGSVVCTSRFDRLKVKNKSYVLAHKAKDSVTSSPRNALEAVLLDKVDDIAPLLPKEVQERLLSLQSQFGDYCKDVDAQVAAFRAEAAGSRKRFAEQVMLSGDWSAPYFGLYTGPCVTAREWFTQACKGGKLSAGSLDTILAKLAMSSSSP